LEVWGRDNIISCNNDALTIDANIICHSTRFDVLEGSVDIKNIYTQIFDEVVHTDVFHWNDDLFVQGAFGGYTDFQLGFILTTNDFLDDFNFFVLEVRESLLDFECSPSNVSRVRLFGQYLSIRFLSIVSRLLFFEIF